MGELPRLEYMVKGIKRKTPRAGTTQLPITLEIVQRLRQIWRYHPEPKDAVMLSAAATMCCLGSLALV